MRALRVGACASGWFAVVVACSSYSGSGDAPDGSAPMAAPPPAPPDAPACDADTATDPQSCGTCGHVCPAHANGFPQCVQSACTTACNTGFGNCDDQEDNGCETSTSNDAKNCGACGHDCLGGTCHDGSCQPVIIAAAQPLASSLTVDDENVY